MCLQAKYIVDSICQSSYMQAISLCVCAPSISGLAELLKVCDGFADSHDIKFNPNKT